MTLTELLVTLAIIGMLAALMLPGLRAARMTALQIQCMNNLKQIGMALLNYANENEESLPCIYDAKTWPQTLFDEGYLGGNKNVLVCPSWAPKQWINYSSTYGLRMFNREASGSITGYNYHFRLTNLEDSVKNLPSLQTTPAEFFFLVDSLGSLNAQRYYVCDELHYGGTNPGVHLRHSGKANAFFADGHVEGREASYFHDNQNFILYR